VVDYTGQKFGRLTLRWPVGQKGRGKNVYWLCSCDCGNMKVICASTVVRNGSESGGGFSKSCGCLRNEKTSQRFSTHGQSGTSEHAMWKSAHRRAKTFSLPFDIHVTDITIPEFCPLLEIRLECGTGKAHANSPTLDRIIPALGYVKGNIQVISRRANAIKNDATLEELERVVSNWRNQC
jgi:hypothetical protein